MTTASLASPASPKAVLQSAPSSVRRRRKRAAAGGGAADDCFACAKRNIECDRARPYCSQCLHVGNECSGYKTRLTWDVGVASRGKLRGLSLPVAKSAPVRRPSRGGGVTKGGGVTRGAAAAAPKGLLAKIRVPGSTSTSTSPPPPSRPNSRPGSYPIAPKPGKQDRHEHGGSDNDGQRAGEPESAGYYFAYTQQPLSPAGSSHPPTPPPYQTCPAMGTPSMPPSATWSQLSFSSGIGMIPFSRDVAPNYLPSPPAPLLYNAYGDQTPLLSLDTPRTLALDPSRPPASCPNLAYGPSEQSAGLHLHIPHTDAFNANVSPRMSQDFNHIGLGVYTPSASPHSQSSCWASSVVDGGPLCSQGTTPEHTPGPWPSVPSPLASSPISQLGVDLLYNMSFLMGYYENVMCPSMVLVDTPNNPFRAHILELAASSASLRHAICALASCNLRVKQRLGTPPPGTVRWPGGGGRGRGVVSASSASGEAWLSEEYQHRDLAFELLNDELRDPARSTRDSALATVLMLCHYRMAESGIARFRAQFAGVKKILAMRRSVAHARRVPPPASTAWMEALFTYFDALSASINDREAQLTGLSWSASDMTPDAPQLLLLPAGSENLIGCDRELFETIARLGRLNMMSQKNGPVRNLAAQEDACSPPSAPVQHFGHSLQRGATPSSPPPPHRQLKTERREEPCAASVDGGDRSAFWQEWEKAHAALRHWRFDPSRVRASLSAVVPPPPHPVTPNSPSSSPATFPAAYPPRSCATSPPPPPPSHPQLHPYSISPAQLRDIASLNEAFRCAAMVYLERLAGPLSPPPPPSSVPQQHQQQHHHHHHQQKAPAPIPRAVRIRELASLALCHAARVAPGGAAEKFLLWPLFVAGSECGDDAAQRAVRARCAGLAARGGYMHNLAALEVMGKVWAAAAGKEEGAAAGEGTRRRLDIGRGGSPFGWTRSMDRKDGEVEWIIG